MSRFIVLLLHVILNEWLLPFVARFDIHWSGVLTVLFGCYMAGATWNCCHWSGILTALFGCYVAGATWNCCHWSGVLTALFGCYMAGATWNCCHWSGILTAQFGCYMAGATGSCRHSGACFVCTPYNHAPVYSVTSFKATCIGCMFILLEPATCTFGRMTRIFYVLLQSNVGGTDTEVRIGAESWPLRTEFSHHSSWGSDPWPFWSRVRCSATELSPLPSYCYAVCVCVFQIYCATSHKAICHEKVDLRSVASGILYLENANVLHSSRTTKVTMAATRSNCFPFSPVTN